MKHGVSTLIEEKKEEKQEAQPDISKHPAFSLSEEERTVQEIKVEKRRANAHQRAPQNQIRQQPHRTAKENPIYNIQEDSFFDDEYDAFFMNMAAWEKENERSLQRDPNYQPYIHSHKPKPSQNILDLMGASLPYAPKAIVSGQTTPIRKKAQSKRGLKTALLSPSKCQKSTPTKQNPSTFFSPIGKSAYSKSREIIINGSTVAIYLPEKKIGSSKLFVPEMPAEGLDTLNINQDSLDALIDVPVTLQKLKSVETQKQKDIALNLDVRYPSQKSVMGISPNVAATQAGINLEQAATLAGMNVKKPHVMHWCHYIPHSLIGNDGQKVTNLGLGTKFCNAEMTLVEPVVETLLKMSGAPNTLYISVEPQYCPGYEKIKLLNRLTYTIKDGSGSDFNHSVSFSFDALSLNRICKSEQEIVKNLLIDVFKKNKNTASAQTTQRFDLLTPKKPSATKPLVDVDNTSVSHSSPPLLFGYKRKRRDEPESPYNYNASGIRKTAKPVPFPGFIADLTSAEKKNSTQPDQHTRKGR